MFEALSGKLLAGVVSLSMLLFSTYKGNDPQLGGISHRTSSSFLYLNTSLVSAFDNDFPSVFASGSTIPVHLDVTLKSDGRVVATRRFVNSVTYDPTTGVYDIKRSGVDRNIKVSDADKVARELSSFECAIPYQLSWGAVDIRMEAWMPAVRFSQIGKDVDLMVLWKYKKPVSKAQINLQRLF